MIETPKNYLDAKDAWSKAYAAISIARKKNSRENAWEWANVAVRHMEQLGINNARLLAGIDAYPNVEALDGALAQFKKNELVIVTHHKGLVEWLNQRGYEGNVVNHATPMDIMGKHVIGKLPLYLSAICASVTQVHIPNIPEHMWGTDLTSEELDKFGAYLRTYVVREVSVVKAEA